MGFFSYRRGSLYCENVELRRLADVFGTPLYVYSQACLLENLKRVKEAFSYQPVLICYSVKANSNINLLRLLLRQGVGLDVVSGGELYRAKLAGCKSKKIVYASVGKTKDEIEAALNYGILMFNVESEAELRLINYIGESKQKKIDVAIRVNPDVSSPTHQYTITGGRETKFGIDIKKTEEIILSRASFYPYINFSGLHLHIGSQIMEIAPFLKAIKRIISLIKRIENKGKKLAYLNIGGGFGIDYYGRHKFPLKKLAKEIFSLVSSCQLNLIIEPGRYISASAGVLLTKVLFLKDTPAKRFVIVDAAMNDLIRPSLYRAYHRVFNLRKSPSPGNISSVDIVGPICESGDFLAKSRRLAVAEGDYLAIMDAGAYGFSMSSHYNSRLNPAEILVNKRRVKLIRRRESLRDLVRKEL